MRWAFRTFESLEGRLPFWFGPSLSLTTVAYALGLTVLGALVAGVLPGLKITEGNPESRLRQSNTGLPGTGVSRLWSRIIIPMLKPCSSRWASESRTGVRPVGCYFGCRFRTDPGHARDIQKGA